MRNSRIDDIWMGTHGISLANNDIEEAVDPVNRFLNHPINWKLLRGSLAKIFCRSG